MPGIAYRNIGIIADNPQAQCFGSVSHTNTDIAESDNAQGPARQFKASKAFLAGFDLFIQFAFATFELAHVIQRRIKIARGQQHTGQNQFLDSIGIGTGRIENGNTPLAHSGQRDIIHPRTGPPDG